MSRRLTIKVCGITRPDDARLCEDLGVDFLGFIFHEPSPRDVSPEIPGSLGRTTCRKVGVFVKQDPEEIAGIMDAGNLDLAQLHGGQDPEFCRAVGARRVIKVFWPERYASIRELQADLAGFADCCRYFLFDAGQSGGGSGKALDFSRLAGLASPRPWLLAGGLGPGNLAPALSQCSPFGLDLNSGVEASPGIKDPDKLKKAINLINQYKKTK